MTASLDGPEFNISPQLRRKLGTKLARLDRVRMAKKMRDGGSSISATAESLGVAPSTVRRLMSTWSTPSAEEIIERAAVAGSSRSELVDQLSRIRYLFHGWSMFSVDDDFYRGWEQIPTAHQNHLLTLEEYEAVCESKRAIARAVLSRAPCDAHRCTDHEEHVYVLCYGQPTMVSSRDTSAWDRELKDCGSYKAYPISHYVGWTTQHPPIKRVRQHAAMSADFVVMVVPGNTGEESVLKQFGSCPKCHGSLDYFTENPDRLTAYPFVP